MLLSSTHTACSCVELCALNSQVTPPAAHLKPEIAPAASKVDLRLHVAGELSDQTSHSWRAVVLHPEHPSHGRLKGFDGTQRNSQAGTRQLCHSLPPSLPPKTGTGGKTAPRGSPGGSPPPVRPAWRRQSVCSATSARLPPPSRTAAAASWQLP